MTESAQIEGTVSVKPAIYTALQLNFNYEALSARAGPQPYLLGTASGCAAVAGTQNGRGGGSTTENHALTADLDWGVELRAEALMLRNVIGSPYVRRLMDDRHLWFRDMAPGRLQRAGACRREHRAGQGGAPPTHQLKMPSCYPYNERVEYRITWTGGAAPAPDPTRDTRGQTCSWKAAESKGTCTFDPSKEFVISLIWPTPGNYSLTVVPVGDTHDRVFAPAPKPTQVNVSVVP